MLSRAQLSLTVITYLALQRGLYRKLTGRQCLRTFTPYPIQLAWNEKGELSL